MGPRSWERGVKLPVTKLQLFFYRFYQDFNIKLTDAFIIKITFYRTQVLRTQCEAASDSIRVIFARLWSQISFKKGANHCNIFRRKQVSD
jgi:hypothetical protein